jgi:hypothetical protein
MHVQRHVWDDTGNGISCTVALVMLQAQQHMGSVDNGRKSAVHGMAPWHATVAPAAAAAVLSSAAQLLNGVALCLLAAAGLAVTCSCTQAISLENPTRQNLWRSTTHDLDRCDERISPAKVLAKPSCLLLTRPAQDRCDVRTLSYNAMRMR